MSIHLIAWASALALGSTLALAEKLPAPPTNLPKEMLLQGAPLNEAASTRMLILAGGLVAEGLSLRSSVQSAIVQILSDDPDVVRALGELVDAVLPPP